MTTATADPAEDPQDPGRRPGPAQPPTPQPAPRPAPKPPTRPTKEAQAAEGESEAQRLPPEFEDDPPPPPAPLPPAALDPRLVGVGRRLQLLVESAGEHLGEARAIAGVLRPDGAAYGRMEGLLQALEYDREALGRAIAQLHAAAQSLAAGEAAPEGAP